MSSDTWSPTWSRAMSPPPSVTPGIALEPRPRRCRARPPPFVGERRGDVGRAPVLRDERAVAAALVADDASCPRTFSASATRSSLRWPAARVGRRAEPHQRDEVRRRAARRSRARCRARQRPPRLRVVEVVARVEQPEHRPAEDAGDEHDHQRAPQEAPAPAVDQRGQAVEHQPGSASIACGSSQQAAHSSPGRERLEVERGDDVEQHPVGEERPQVGRAWRRSRPATWRTSVGEALAHVRPGSPGRRRPRSSASGTAARCGRPAGRVVGVAHRLHALLRRQVAPRRRRTSRRSASCIAVVAGEEQLALGAEQAEQVRLRDARLARDLVGRGAVVAVQREVPDRDLDDLARGAPRRNGGSGRRPCR